MISLLLGGKRVKTIELDFGGNNVRWMDLEHSDHSESYLHLDPPICTDYVSYVPVVYYPMLTDWTRGQQFKWIGFYKNGTCSSQSKILNG